MRWLQSFVLLAALAGCAGDNQDSRPASFKLIVSTILAPSCGTSSCHSKLSQTKGLILDSVDDAYASLTHADDPMVQPGSPENSELMHWLEGDEDKPMPPDLPLADADVELIRQWIADGAQKN